jgi:hypothetical protein
MASRAGKLHGRYCLSRKKGARLPGESKHTAGACSGQPIVQRLRQYDQGYEETQWGWGDFIDLFSLINKVAVVNFLQNGSFVYNPHRSLATIKQTLFLVNVQDALARGMCYTQFPCADT